MVLGIVDDAELAWCDAMNLVIAVNDKRAIGKGLYGGRMAVWGMPNLEGYMLWQSSYALGKKVESVNSKVAAIGCGGVIAMTDVENILLRIFLHHEPGTSPETETLTLPNSMEPVAAMLANLLACLELDDISNLFANIAADIFVVVDIAKEADTLRVFALGVDEMFALSDVADFILNIVADREDGFLQLPLIDLREEVSLVFDRVGTCGEPFMTVYPFSLCIVPGSNEVVVVPLLFVEGTELDEPIAHHVGIRSEATLDFLHGVACDLRPVLLMAIDNLQAAAIFGRHGGCHLEVFLRVAVPFLFLLGANLDVEAVGVEATAGKLVDDDGTVDATGEQDGDALVT